MMRSGPLAMLDSQALLAEIEHDKQRALGIDAPREGVVEAESMLDEFVLLAGPPGCGKTSLLFQYAANICQLGLHAIFICFEARMKERCPLAQIEARGACKDKLSPRKLDPSLERLHLKYIVENEQDMQHEATNMLIEYLGQLHRLPMQPHLIVLDDLSTLNCNAHSLACILGLLENARLHASRVHKWTSEASKADHMQPGVPFYQPCRVIAADSISRVAGTLDIRHKRTICRFAKSIWLIKELSKQNTAYDGKRCGNHGHDDNAESDWKALLDFELSCQVCIRNAPTVPAFQLGVYKSNGMAVLATHILVDRSEKLQQLRQ